jgi:hypothetical protein
MGEATNGYGRNKLRLGIFVLWVGFWVLSCLSLLGARFVRPGIMPDEIPDAIISVTGMWMPVLGCLAAFWFADQEHEDLSKDLTVDPYKALGAMIITVAYLGLVFIYILWSVFGVDTTSREYIDPFLPPGVASFPERISTCLKWAAIGSPFGTAPVIWLTKGKSRSITPESLIAADSSSRSLGMA